FPLLQLLQNAGGRKVKTCAAARGELGERLSLARRLHVDGDIGERQEVLDFHQCRRHESRGANLKFALITMANPKGALWRISKSKATLRVLDSSVPLDLKFASKPDPTIKRTSNPGH